MALHVKEKELAAVGISVAAGCRPCTDYHVGMARKAGSSNDEIRQAVADAVWVRRSATETMEQHALQHLGVHAQNAECGCGEVANRQRELTRIGAAFAVNCTENLEKYLKAGRDAGLSEDEIQEVIRLAGFVRKMAVSHVRKLVETEDTEAEENKPGAEVEVEAAASCCSS